MAQADAGITAGYRADAHCGIFTAWASLGGAGTLGNTHASVLETLGQQAGSERAQIGSVGSFAPSAGGRLAGKLNRLAGQSYPPIQRVIVPFTSIYEWKTL